MWRETTKHSRNRRIWDEELSDFVPEHVLDFHVHIMNAGVIPAGKTFSSGGHDIAKYDLADLEQDLREMYPGRQTSAVCFGFPDPRYDFAANNRYVADGCDSRRFFALRLFDPINDKPDQVRADLAGGRFLGLKPYPDYVRSDLGFVEIKQMLPPWIMQIADELHLLIMLHIPRPGRLADPVNQAQIVEWCRTYPNARIILAHIGRAYFLKNIVGSLDRLKDLPNLYYDLTMVTHWEVMEYAFTTLPPDRVVFGTDIPIALAPGKSVEINDQYTYVTPVPWSLSISDDHRKLIFTSFLYEQIRAMKRACQRARLGPEFVRGLFHDNGRRLLESVPR
jgi:hypothetical protein